MRWFGQHRIHMELDGVQRNVMRIRGDRFRAVLEVGGVPFGLLSDSERRVILVNYAAFLNGLSFPIQTLVRVLPADVDGYLGRIEHRARHDLPEQLAELALDHVAFVRGTARSRNLLERHFYIVVPAPEAGRTGLPAWPLRRRRDTSLQLDAARKQLTFRCDEMTRQLARCGLNVRRLEDVELAELVYACWCPELSRLQRLRRDLAGYTTLAVRGAQNALRPSARQQGDPA